MKHAFLIVATAALLALAGCRGPEREHGGQAAAPMELKIYDVPAAQTEKLAGALGNALGGGASITMPAPGKLLAYAPHDTQASIGQAIESLGAEGSAAAPAVSQVDLHFWIIDAGSGDGADDASLKPLATTLDAVRKTVGPMHFRLVQSMSAMASIGHPGNLLAAAEGGYLRGIDFQINAVAGDTLDLSVSYNDVGETSLAKFKTEISAQSGHYVVLAQAPGACERALPGMAAPTCVQKPALRLFVVRADRLPSHA